MKMEDLTDDLLAEILIRVPCKTALICKSISKRFLSLISHCQFIERFIHRCHTLFRHMNDEDRENAWSMIFQSRRKLFILFLPNIHLPTLQDENPLSLSFLGPEFNPQREDATESTLLATKIVGYSNGLLLCRKSAYDRVYFVCNPVTRDWVQLPPFAGIRNCGLFGDVLKFEGFICEPYYHVEGEGRVSVRPSNTHRFRVVLFHSFSGTKFEFELRVFSSETGQWTTNLVSCPNGFAQAANFPPPVAHGGRLYFQGDKSLLVYDPFNNDRQSYTLDYPPDSNPRNIAYKGHFGVSCGNIRISDISPTSTSSAVSVWELDNSDWCLLHRTCLPPMNMEDSVTPKLGDTNSADVRVRAFHPYHADVVIFQYAHRIFFGNLNTNQIQTATYGIYSSQIIPLDLPWWPTPIPKSL